MKFSYKVWNTSLKNISFHLQDHPELSETIMLEPGAACSGKKNNAPQIRPTSWFSSCQFQCQQWRVQGCDVCQTSNASDVDLKFHFTWTAKSTLSVLKWKFQRLLHVSTCICLRKVRSSLEVDLCSKISKSMQGHVSLRTSLPKTKGTGASELAIKLGIEARCGDAPAFSHLGFLQTLNRLVSVAPSTWNCCNFGDTATHHGSAHQTILLTSIDCKYVKDWSTLYNLRIGGRNVKVLRICTVNIWLQADRSFLDQKNARLLSVPTWDDGAKECESTAFTSFQPKHSMILHGLTVQPFVRIDFIRVTKMRLHSQGVMAQANSVSHELRRNSPGKRVPRHHPGIITLTTSQFCMA